MKDKHSNGDEDGGTLRVCANVQAIHHHASKSGSWEFVSQAGVLFLVGELVVAETIRS